MDLISLFDKAAESPEFIPKLRQLILDLAVRGKLVPQNPKDEPASELLKKIKTEKDKLIKEGKIRPEKNLPPVDKDEIPFEIPRTWKWSQLAEIGEINPRNHAPDDLETSFVPMKMIFSELGKMNEHEPKKWKEIKTGFTHFAEGDVGLVSCIINS